MNEKLRKKLNKAINQAPRLHNRTYDKRARINGIDIVGYASTPEECQIRFLSDLNQKFFEVQNDNGQNLFKRLPSNFHEFAMFYFENVRKRKNTERTHNGDLNRYKNHVQPRFAKLNLKTITTEYCQDFIDELEATGKGKTTDEIFSMLNCIFQYAVDRGTLTLNPMKTVVHVPHKTKHGKALSLDEEKKLFDATLGTEYQVMFAIALYTGMRPNEYETASLHDGMIIAKNSKRKNAKFGDIEWKRIPVCPMLAPFLEGVTEIDMYIAETMRYKFKEIFPNRSLKDLRTTFYTRCETCDVSDVARDEFVGHSSGAIHDSYSDLPDDYLKKEAKKICYPLDITVAPIFAPEKDSFGLAKKRGKTPKPRFKPEKS